MGITLHMKQTKYVYVKRWNVQRVCNKRNDKKTAYVIQKI